MLAEQHCVCTESGLKNVFSTRYVVGRQTGDAGGGKRTFFFPLSLRRWLVGTKTNRLRWAPPHHFSFLLRLLRALLSCCRFHPAVTVLGSQEHNQPQGPPCPNQRNACRNRCKGGFWPPSWHAPSCEGKRRSKHAQGCRRISRCHTGGKRGRGNVYSSYNDRTREAGDVAVCKVLA